jgi:gamma-glutamylputrescine oxidase
VGAGITGLAAAHSIARRNRDVVVVEHAFGSGATARSGGIILGETLVGPALEFAGCEGALREWIAANDVDCDLEWTGCLELARDTTLPVHPIDWKDEGVIRVAAEVPGGVLHPTRLLSGLAVAAARAGAWLSDTTTALAMESGPGEVRVITDRGPVTAHHVVMAVDATGWTRTLDPWSERDITVTLQTEPIARDTLAAVGLGGHQPFFTRDLPLLWGRVMSDRSLLVGRELLPFPLGDAHDQSGSVMAAAGERLVQRVRRLHPALAGIVRQRVWSGPIARTAAGRPMIVGDSQLPRVIWVGGYGGHGLAQAFRLGSIVADHLMPHEQH